MELHDWRTPLSARAVALAFLSTTRAPMRTAALIRRAEICDVDGAAVRMALGRLVRDGVVEQPARGLYAIGARGQAVNRLARGWAQAEARVRDWHGRWIVVAVDHLGRGDRRALRLRERALRLTGLVRADSGLWVRPDNLALPLPDLAAQLCALGLEPGAPVLGDVAVPDHAAAAWRALWPGEEIADGYRHWIAQIAASEARLPGLSATQAARETLLLGQSVIRAINLDPLLPAAMVDTRSRRDMIESMRRYDATGKGYWATIDRAARQ
ncbi:hypothetical protein ASG29_15755 [Sphingomonas sp. Leaf412]|uniref:hypothetical protein n=1 Tax=Sphingomonas sp. Leaf412 TaxID=1736370 RepID=UPI0006F355EF|nr:hypothetical protein [Sphingomonas sp. Leaf412]KQT31393.1 hypothetical protein ASG29_15755 [Sphingomonas sp. Leaf412]